MYSEETRRLSALLLVLFPAFCWLAAARRTETLSSPKWKSLGILLTHTHEKPILLVSALAGLLVAIGLIYILRFLGHSEFSGAPFRRFLRGTRMVNSRALVRKLKEKEGRQISVAGLPMPSSIETLHMLISGATGSGKSVLMREMAFSALKRGDRIIVLDPNGDMFSKFGRKGDVLLNPYDARTEGWSFFNELRADYDFHRYALSIVPRGKTADAEEWASFGRLLLRETAKKLVFQGTPSVKRLSHWTTKVDPKELRKYLNGTEAESLFVGSSEASNALGSARFVLSDKLPEHVHMPEGSFSLRTWLEEGKGNLFITWREDMAEALKPLISAWIDVLFVSVLSMPEDKNRRIWAFIDELASLEKLASLEAALTKGRKHGLRVVAGLQSTAQLDDIYDRDAAQTLRSCFRSLVVLGGAKTDPKTCEELSKSLGDHEVEREEISRHRGVKGHSRNVSYRRDRERVVSPSEIASLPDLTGYVAFAGNYPITKVQLKLLNFMELQAAFEERKQTLC